MVIHMQEEQVYYDPEVVIPKGRKLSLYEARRAVGFRTVADLSKAADVAESTLGRVERKVKDPSERTVMKILYGLNTRFRYEEKRRFLPGDIDWIIVPQKGR